MAKRKKDSDMALLWLIGLPVAAGVAFFFLMPKEEKLAPQAGLVPYPLGNAHPNGIPG